MSYRIRRHWFPMCLGVGVAALLTIPVVAQLVDKTQTFQVVEGIALSLTEEIGAGRGDVMTPDSSSFIVGRDPFRAIRRGRQLFQRKFTRAQGQGPGVGDGFGEIATTNEIGAGLADSCAACHGRPRGSAGFGGDVATRPDSRDAPHLFGLGLKEMLADEITADLRAQRSSAIAYAMSVRHSVTVALTSKEIHYGYRMVATGREPPDVVLARGHSERAHQKTFSIQSTAY